MKNHSKAQLFAGTLALGLLFSLASPAAVQAAEEEYTYTVTLSAGQKGSSTGSGVEVVGDKDGNYSITPGDGKITISGLNAGARVNFTAQDAATLPDDTKYYVQGVRISGQDNTTARANSSDYNATYTSPSFAVHADADYVVAYGILGDMVQYTVNYQDESGAELAPSRTYYGNVGDSPVIAYLYVDGYQPQSYNLTKKLVSNSAKNVFTFVYRAIAGPSNGDNGGSGSGSTPTAAPASPDGTTPGDEVEEIVITGTPAPGTTGTGTGTTGAGTGIAGGDATANGDNGNGAQPAGDNGNSEADAANNGDNGGEAAADAPQELIDIDENQTPLANLAGQVSDTVSNLSPVAIGGGIGVGVLVLLGLVLLLKRRKKGRAEGHE